MRASTPALLPWRLSWWLCRLPCSWFPWYVPSSLASFPNSTGAPLVGSQSPGPLLHRTYTCALRLPLSISPPTGTLQFNLQAVRSRFFFLGG
ncbi:uncharacterized protein P884DRAFT_264731 [Thermothelomyces heterothallicus CBS 202.75]|uniref:uncharacterized protein n=1 Tax=Thermothelomyces heterothallicus CBS 202.75 TaxID=1149848 RepID=UPI003743605E